MVLLVFIIIFVGIFCYYSFNSDFLSLPEVGRCPDHCNCAVYTSQGEWVGCQRARITLGCRPHHKDRVCRHAFANIPALKGAKQFKVGCCGASCDHPHEKKLGHALDCRFENNKWKGHLRSCNFAGEDLRCHK